MRLVKHACITALLFAGGWFGAAHLLPAWQALKQERALAPHSVGAALPDISVPRAPASPDSLHLSSLLAPSDTQTALVLLTSWCGYCFGELKAWQSVADADRRVVALILTDQPDFLRRAQTLISPTYPIYLMDSVSADQLRAFRIPTIYVVDNQLTVKQRAIGIVASDAIRRELLQSPWHKR